MYIYISHTFQKNRHAAALLTINHDILKIWPGQRCPQEDESNVENSIELHLGRVDVALENPHKRCRQKTISNSDDLWWITFFKQSVVGVSVSYNDNWYIKSISFFWRFFYELWKSLGCNVEQNGTDVSICRNHKQYFSSFQYLLAGRPGV